MTQCYINHKKRLLSLLDRLHVKIEIKKMGKNDGNLRLGSQSLGRFEPRTPRIQVYAVTATPTCSSIQRYCGTMKKNLRSQKGLEPYHRKAYYYRYIFLLTLTVVAAVVFFVVAAVVFVVVIAAAAAVECCRF
jgi:Flp pilus assembly protein TadB